LIAKIPGWVAQQKAKSESKRLANEYFDIIGLHPSEVIALCGKPVKDVASDDGVVTRRAMTFPDAYGGTVEVVFEATKGTDSSKAIIGEIDNGIIENDDPGSRLWLEQVQFALPCIVKHRTSQ
jgi:hypothetical protein